MTGIFIAPIDVNIEQVISAMDEITNAWEAKAARGECGWICADCCQSFPDGMPNECCHGHQSCTDIIARFKARALSEVSQPIQVPDES